MSTIRIGHRTRYVLIDQRAVEDTRLSLRAKGLLVWLLAKPDDWEIRRDAIADAVAEGQSVVRATLKELTAAGYLVRERSRATRGRFTTTTILYEYPPEAMPAGEQTPDQGAAKPQVGPLVDLPPPADEPAADRPAVGRPALLRPNQRPNQTTTEPFAPTAPEREPSVPARIHDEPFEALCHTCRIDWHELTETERRRVNYAMSQIRKAWAKAGRSDDQLPAAIYTRAQHYLEAWDTSLTPMALAGRWASLAQPPPTGHRLTGADRGLVAAQRWTQRRAVEG